MNYLLDLARNPLLYGGIAAYFAAAFAAWRTVKKRYWHTNLAFSLITFGLAAALGVGLAVSLLLAGPYLRWQSLWQDNHPVISLAGAYLGLAGLAIWQTKRLRYPLFKTLDFVAVGLSIAETIIWASWLVDNHSVVNLIVGLALLIQTGLLFWLAGQTWAQEKLAGIHLSLLFLLAVVLNIMSSSWQNLSGLLELVFNSGWLVVGCGLLLRNTTKRRMYDLPRGVSQAFRDTFTRAFVNTAPKTPKES